MSKTADVRRNKDRQGFFFIYPWRIHKMHVQLSTAYVLMGELGVSDLMYMTRLSQ